MFLHNPTVVLSIQYTVHAGRGNLMTECMTIVDMGDFDLHTAPSILNAMHDTYSNKNDFRI